MEYPERIGEAGREWLRAKPFANEPRETARHLIDAGYVIELLDLRPGMRFVELGCGPGWMTRFVARHGLEAHGYDISPGDGRDRREQARAEGVDARYETADLEKLGRERAVRRVPDLRRAPPQRAGRARDPCAHRALRPGGRCSSRSRTGSSASRAATRPTNRA